MVLTVEPAARRPGTARSLATALVSLVAATAAGVAAASAAGCRHPPPNLDSPGSAVVCLGDSITAGVGASPGRAFPEVLAERLGREVINHRVPGDTAADGLARLPQ